MLNKFTQSLLFVLSVVVFAACGLSPAPEEPTTAPTAIAFSPCDSQPCSWKFLGTNPISDAVTGTSAIFPAVAVDASGNPVVAYQQSGLGIVVKRFAGGVWNPIGGPIPGTATGGLNYTLVLETNGNPWVSYHDTLHPIKLARWNGSMWVPFKDAPFSNAAGAGMLVLDRGGQPVVVGGEYNPTTDINSIRVNRWNGQSWVSLPLIENGSFAKIAVDANNQILVAFFDPIKRSLKVKRSQNNRWKNMGTVSALYFAGHVLKVDSQGRAVVANGELAGGQGRLVVKRWNGSNAFVPLGSVISVPYNGQPAMDVQGTNISVGYTDSNNLIRVVSFDPASNNWVQKGTVVNDSTTAASANLSMAYKPTGDLVVSWHSYNTANLGRVFVKHWSP